MGNTHCLLGRRAHQYINYSEITALEEKAVPSTVGTQNCLSESEQTFCKRQQLNLLIAGLRETPSQV